MPFLNRRHQCNDAAGSSRRQVPRSCEHMNRPSFARLREPGHISLHSFRRKTHFERLGAEPAYSRFSCARFEYLGHLSRQGSRNRLYSAQAPLQVRSGARRFLAPKHPCPLYVLPGLKGLLEGLGAAESVGDIGYGVNGRVPEQMKLRERLESSILVFRFLLNIPSILMLNFPSFLDTYTPNRRPSGALPSKMSWNNFLCLSNPMVWLQLAFETILARFKISPSDVNFESCILRLST